MAPADVSGYIQDMQHWSGVDVPQVSAGTSFDWKLSSDLSADIRGDYANYKDYIVSGFDGHIWGLSAYLNAGF